MTTPYRDDTDSLEARHAALAEELTSVKAKTKELDELKTSEARLEREVADVQKKLEGRAARRALPLLESIRIASPCTASWDEMIGDDRARFCTHCQKDVFNLSALPRDEAESFLRERTGDVCVRLYKRTDGTVLTSDCPVGVKRKRRRKLAIAAVGGGLLGAGALFQMATSRATMQGEVTMGAMPMTPPEQTTMGLLPAEEPVVETPPEHIMGKMKMPEPTSKPATPKPLVKPSPKPGTAR